MNATSYYWSFAIMTQPNSDAVAGSVFKSFANFTRNTCAGVSFLTKMQAFRPATLLKKKLLHRDFLVKFEKFLKNAYFEAHLWKIASVYWLLHLYWFLQFTQGLLPKPGPRPWKTWKTAGCWKMIRRPHIIY